MKIKQCGHEPRPRGRSVRAAGFALGLSGLLGYAGTVHAQAVRLAEGLDLRYKLTVGYGVAVRVEEPADELINGPIDPVTSLPTTINFDDGDRNFKKGALINNRVSALGELLLEGENYGLSLSGSAFADRAYLNSNDNGSASTVNKSGAHNEFTDGARRYDGERARLLDAYVYGNWWLTDDIYLGLRAGRCVVAWGESLFFGGIALAQGAADATKANVPGAEIKDILLPTNQVGLQLGLNESLQLLAYYKLEFKAFELPPVGDYFAIVDVVGPGSEFIYGAKNPVYPTSGPVESGTPEYINIQYAGEVDPGDDGQYGFGLKYDLTPTTGIGMYYLNYTSGIPTLRLNWGYAAILPPAGQTEAAGVPAPVTYNAVYFDDIKLYGLSFSTLAFGMNLAGEATYRDGIDTLVNTANGPTATRGRATQLNVNGLYVAGPSWLWDALAVVADVTYLRMNDVDPVDGSRDLFNTREGWAFQLLAIPELKSIFHGWDLALPVVVGGVPRGTPAVSGGFGALAGEGDYRASVGSTFTYLQTLQWGVSYNAFLGEPKPLTRPYADRDYVAFNIKYQF